MNLRNYQNDINTDINTAWNAGHRNVMAVMPTGSGKTHCFTKILAEHPGTSIAIAHRQELVGQMSLTLAKRGILHNIVAPRNVINNICRIHTDELDGQCYFSPRAKCHVAGVNTLVRRKDQPDIQELTKLVTLWVIDEAAHVLKDNTWGKAASMFPYAKGLGVTATPLRLDGKGLGRYHDGIMDVMVEGPNMRDLINQGFLTDYIIFGPSTKDLNLGNVKITSSGEYSHKQLTKEVRQSTIIGNIVEHYQRIAPGKLGITFVTDVETAKDVAQQYNDAGVPAVSLDAKTPDRERITAIRKFRNREILQLVNVDLFSEGFDLPAIEVVSMARPTQSYSWYVQAFGRALRPMPGKGLATIIDHVGNWTRHGLPDAPRQWSLDRKSRKKKADDSKKIKACPNCTGVFEAYKIQCPYCGFKPVPTRRDAPEYVDGDLTEIDAETLARMRGEVKRFDRTDEEVRKGMLNSGASQMVAYSVAKNHRKAQEAQEILRPIIRQWGDTRRAAGHPDPENYRLFYLSFGIDVLTAQTYNRVDAEQLIKKILMWREP